ncbi:MAG: hypothetical protein EXS04_05040 [Phycisphaerales bacterium]|nr:hypothetical protein [Phycisphaerales bacterium]
MPLIINVGVSRKASKDFQSAGYSLNLTAELDQGLLGDSVRLQSEIERIYGQAEIALDRQVAVGSDIRSSKALPLAVLPVPVTVSPVESGFDLRHRQQSATSGNGGRVFNGNFNGGGNGVAHSTLRPITESQMRALRAIARRLPCDLARGARCLRI